VAEQPRDRSLISLAFHRGLAARTGFLIFIAASLSAYAGMVALHIRYDTLSAAQVPAFLACYGVAFVTYIGALLWAERLGRVPSLLIYGGAIAFQLLLLCTVPTLSDDIYRYLWDGYVGNHGVSPYAYAISAPELNYLDVPIRALANHPEMASPYLPVAQWLFRAVTWLSPLRPIYLQAAMALLNLGAAWFIARLLRIAGLPGHRVLIYLWNPLVVVETAHGAHLDVWMVFLALLAVWLALVPGETRRARLRRGWLSPVALALATLTKIVPVLLLPVLWPKWRWPARFLYILVIIALLVPAGLTAGWGLTGPLDGRGLFGALRIYNRAWRFNSGIFNLLAGLLSALRLPSADHWARVFVGLLLLAVLAFVWRVARGRREPRALLRLMALPFMAYILFTTTLHPWYLLILLAFLPFGPPGAGESSQRWWWVAPWLYLSGVIVLSYLSYVTPDVFRDLAWVRLVEWLPTWGLLIAGAVLGFRRKEHQGTQARLH
jgi:alpha-1,6-mannosyltransferase